MSEASALQPPDRPRVSVCMAVWNGAAHLPAQLTSIMEQLAPNDELVVVDDASTDDSVRLIETFSDARIRIVRLTRQGGPTAAFERAIQESRGQFVFLSDQDDVWLPGKVSVTMHAFERTGALCVMSDARMVDEAERPIHGSFFAYRRCGPGVLKNFYKTTYLGCCMAFRAEAKSLLLPFPRPRLAHDVWIGFASELAGSLYFLPETLLLYRRHGANHSPLRRANWPGVAWIRIKYLTVLLRSAPRWGRFRWHNRAGRAFNFIHDLP